MKDDERTALTAGERRVRATHDSCGATAGEEDAETQPKSWPMHDGEHPTEAAAVWAPWGLVLAYFGIFLISLTTSLEGQVTGTLSAFVVSDFDTHSLISTVMVVQGIINAVIKAPMAKVADVFGRLEAFTISIILYVAGYVQMALSHHVQTYACAQIFYAAGSTGLQMLQQVFIADTSSLVDRALYSSLPDFPFLATVWIGPVLGAWILSATTWRWGFAMWAVILPVAFVPLAATLFVHKKAGSTRAAPSQKPGAVRAAIKLAADLDAGGLVLLSLAFGLVLLPLTLSSRSEAVRTRAATPGLIVLGLACLVIFGMWEASPKLAPHPMIPPALLASRTFCAGCLVGFFYFMVFYLSIQPYFYSYLLVVHNQSVAAAARITQTFSFTATVANLVNSLLLQHTKRLRPMLVAGSVVYASGVLLLLCMRTQQASVALLVAGQAALGIGASLLHLPCQLAVQAAAGSLGPRYVSAATAVFMTLVEVGGAVGAAVSGAVWSSLVPAKLDAYLPPAARPDAAAIFRSVLRACSYDWRSPARDAINRSYQETMTLLLTVAAAMCVPILALGLLVEDYSLDRLELRVDRCCRQRGDAQASRGLHVDSEDDGEPRSVLSGSGDPGTGGRSCGSEQRRGLTTEAPVYRPRHDPASTQWIRVPYLTSHSIPRRGHGLED